MNDILTTHEPSGSTLSLEYAPKRLGFLGVGWIGLHRLTAVSRSSIAQVIAVADADPAAAAQAMRVAPYAVVASSLEALLELDLDGIVIATPSALHASQAIAALESGKAVFCQKPLARTAAETRRIVETARRTNRLLGVDFSYRFVNGIPQIQRMVQRGELGTVYAIDVVFHNAYGPDKPWFYNPKLSGGGCVIDLGVHLVDLALWLLDFPVVDNVSSRLYAGGAPLPLPTEHSEDYAVVQIELNSGALIRLACSWKLSAGRDAIIELMIYGTQGGAAMRNMNGSFYDFVVEQFHGTTSRLISTPPDEWGGRAIINWAERLAAGARYDGRAEQFIEVATVVDRIYGR